MRFGKYKKKRGDTEGREGKHACLRKREEESEKDGESV